MNYKNFIKWALIQPASVLDYDKTYGLQCVDLIKWYIKKVRGIEPQSIGNAIDYYKKRKSDYIKNVVANGGNVYVLNSIEKAQSFLYKSGDIIVFGGGKYGHIAILDSYDKIGVNVYDTNYKGNHTTTALHRYLFRERLICCIIRLSDKYTQIEKKYFTPNAIINVDSAVFADNNLTEKTGAVFKGERVSVRFKGKVLSMIQYNTSAGYKIGLISNKNITLDK